MTKPACAKCDDVGWTIEEAETRRYVNKGKAGEHVKAKTVRFRLTCDCAEGERWAALPESERTL